MYIPIMWDMLADENGLLQQAWDVVCEKHVGNFIHIFEIYSIHNWGKWMTL